MICSSCHKPASSIKTVISRGKIVTGCNNCLSTLVYGTDLAAQNHRQHDRRKFAADNLQPFEEGYAKIYGEENAREHGWDDEALRKFG